MSPFLETLLLNSIITAGMMLVLWIVATRIRNVGIVDVYWGLGFAIVAWASLLRNEPATSRVWLLAVLTSVWGLRLAGHLTLRNWGEAEDRRYAAMRRHHGPRFWWVSGLTVFMLQAILLLFISLPLQLAATQRSANPWGVWDALGIVLWSTGFVFETVGDRQLTRFRNDPLNRDRVLDRGLWRYTRHPNYFGDFCVWWGLYLIAAAGGAGWTIASPLLMSFLLLRVSGVTLLEQTISERRPEYAAYRKRTSAFFPWPPARG